MTGTTSGQTSLPTATDSDDTENFLTVSLTAGLQALANLFESASGHDHSGAGKGKPIVSAGIASGVTLTSPHFTTATVDSGGLTVTAGNVGITAGNITFGAATSKIIPGATSLSLRNNADSADNVLVTDAGLVTVRAGALIGGTAPSSAGGQVGLGGGNPALGGGATATFGTIGGSGPTIAGQLSWWAININGASRFVPLWG